ncbi:MAG: thermonuclease family protein [Aquificae bacterium]|nr:thermonuclease family protein [Aquificota bacterium]
MKKKATVPTVVALIIAVAVFFLEKKFPELGKILKQGQETVEKKQQGQGQGDVIPPGEYKAKVVKVADGDTLTVQLPDGRKAKLRLLWIDTPEKNEGYKLLRDVDKCKTSKKKMKEMGQKATAYAKRNFHAKDEVKVKIEGQGQFKRYLALIWNKEGELYNEEIIKDGYACIYRKAKYPKYLEDLLEEAKKKRRGLWKDYYKIMECLCYD